MMRAAVCGAMLTPPPLVVWCTTDYSCAVESKVLLHGRMYVSDRYICFYSNFFGFEKKVSV